MFFTASQYRAIIRGTSKHAPALLTQPGAGPTGSEDTVSNTDFIADQTVAAGDPFICAGERKPDPPCVCNLGLVSIGVMTTDESGDEVEKVYILPCRKCQVERPAQASLSEGEGS
jgi:hypothetical protein